jgi:quercetin dioxygenase-like cupin family protein
VTRIVDIAALAGGGPVARLEGADHGAAVSLFTGFVPKGGGPVLHRHPYEETFVLQTGAATFSVDGEEAAAEGGQIVVVPAGSAHRFVVTSDAPMRFVSVHPAPRMMQEDLGG